MARSPEYELDKEVIELINSGLVGLHMKGKLADDLSAVSKNQLKLGRRSVLGVHWKD